MLGKSLLSLLVCWRLCSVCIEHAELHVWHALSIMLIFFSINLPRMHALSQEPLKKADQKTERTAKKFDKQ